MAPGAAAFFDLDKTVIARSSMVAFGPALLRAGMITRRRAAQAAWRNLVFGALPASPTRIERYRRSGQRIVTGWCAEDVRRVVEAALDDAICPIVFREALDEVALHRAAGRRTVLASAGPIEIVAPVAQRLGFDDHLASVATVDADGRYTGEATAWLHGSGKADAVRQYAQQVELDLDACWAYTDALSDLPLLEAVGHPVVVNAERPLARLAAARGWRSVHFHRREGLPGPHRTQTEFDQPGAVTRSARAVAPPR